MSNIGGISCLRNFLEMVMEHTRENPIRDIFACPQRKSIILLETRKTSIQDVGKHH
jgi:hypothetical protein